MRRVGLVLTAAFLLAAAWSGCSRRPDPVPPKPPAGKKSLPWELEHLIPEGTGVPGAGDADAAKVRQAAQALLNVYEDRLRESAAALSEAVGEMHRLQVAALAHLRTIGGRVDVEPPPLAAPEMPNLAGLGLADLYDLHARLEQQAARAYERLLACQLAARPEQTVPLGQCLATTSLTMPERRKVNAAALALPPDLDDASDERFRAYRMEILDTGAESQDILRTALRWLELARVEMEAPEASATPPAPPAKRAPLARPDHARIALGNTITAGAPADWVSLDRWYVVGPFGHPGPGRRLEDLDRKCPPETQSGLDWVSIGKGGRQVRWKYRRTGQNFREKGLCIEPFTADLSEYAIYYFWAEFYSDADRQVLATFAADDWGKAWLNGREVYRAPPDPQPCIPFAEGSFRVLDLKKGVNQVLFKLENVRGATGFSTVLMTRTDPDLIRAMQEQAEPAPAAGKEAKP